jgi:hypothetical protein
MPDLFDVLPSLGRTTCSLLASRRVALIGVYAILHDEESYYFEVKGPRHWGRRADGAVSVGIGGYGGRLEAGERPLTCLRRGVQEQLGIGFRLEVSERTALVQGWRVVAWLDLPPSRKHPAPYLVSLFPPRLGGADTPDYLAILAFRGRPRRQPRRRGPSGLLAVSRSALDIFGERSEWPLQEVQAHPGLFLDLAEELPADCVLRPVLAARAFQAVIAGGAVP